MDFPQRNTETGEYIWLGVSEVKWSEGSWFLCLSVFPSVEWLQKGLMMHFENKLIKWFMRNAHVLHFAKHMDP